MEERYYIEHDFIPNMLAEKPEQLITALLNGRGSCMKNIYDIIYKNVDGENPYSAEDFKVEHFKIDENFSFICINMPQNGLEPLLCQRVYLFYDSDFEQTRYFTIEKSFSSDELYICSWKDGSHINYKPAPDDINEETDTIISLAIPESADNQ